MTLITSLPAMPRPVWRHRALHLILAACLALGVPAGARAQAVLVELFTSQGCAACPPADAFLRELADRPDVVALALHVDYWDYLGWRDVFAMPAFSARQTAYREAAGKRSVYTPEMVVHGISHHAGARRPEILQAIAAAAAAAPAAVFALAPMGEVVEVRLRPHGAASPAGVVWVVGYRRETETVRILAGENNGREAMHANVAVDWRRLGDWNGRGEAVWSVAIPAEGTGLALIFQLGQVGPVVTATKIER